VSKIKREYKRYEVPRMAEKEGFIKKLVKKVDKKIEKKAKESSCCCCCDSSCSEK
jgi:hypothetical protein